MSFGPSDDYGLLRELQHMNRANEARSSGDAVQAEHHSMMARLAANRERNRLSRLLSPKPSQDVQDEKPTEP
jgi:hypothetical protein